MHELLMGIKLNQFPLLTIFHVKGAVLNTIRNKKPATHYHPEIAFIIVVEVEMQFVMWKV